MSRPLGPTLLAVLLCAACTGAPRDPALVDDSLAEAAVSGPSAEATARGGPVAGPPNILLVIMDDVGVDQSACYSRPVTTRAPQPTLEALCARGVTFNRAWANPYCSPTRAGILTGRYSHRTGVGEPLGSGAPGPSIDEHTLPQAIEAAETGHAVAAFGKWHLADDDNGGIDHPNLAGFVHFAGGIDGHVDDFYEWPRVVDGVEDSSTDYLTSATVDDALDWISEQRGPWFAWVGFHAPHWPLHLPPADLHSYADLSGTDADIDAQPEQYYQAMLEAVDTELGRLLAGLGPRALRDTVVIVVGDNGTESSVNQGAYAADHAKGSVYEGGVHVPLVVAGPGVVGRGRSVSAMVNTVDLFSTIIELAGGDVDTAVPEDVELDSVSIVPYLEDPFAPSQRDFVLTETFGTRRGRTTAGRAVSDGRFKLVTFHDGSEHLFDLRTDPEETVDLLDDDLSVRQAEAYTALSDILDARPLPID